MIWTVALLLAKTLMAQTAPAAPGQDSFQRGLAQHQAADYDAAIASFQSALKSNFNPPGAMMRIGRGYAKKKDLDHAMEWVAKSAAAGFRFPNVILADADLAELRADPRFVPILAQFNRNARPCQLTPGYRNFDFWIGEWEVTTLAAGPAGPKAESSIEKAIEGCAIVEHWFAAGRGGPPGTRGTSLNYFNPATGKWKQHWVTDTGIITEYEGTFRDGSMRFVVVSTTGPANGIGRMTFTPLRDGSVRQHLEQSTDAGNTWITTFDANYSKKK